MVYLVVTMKSFHLELKCIYISAEQTTISGSCVMDNPNSFPVAYQLGEKA